MQEKISKFEDFITQLQQNITTALEQHETNAAKFISDKWQKPDTPDQKLKGYGNSMIIEGGEIFEKGVVAFSRVHGSELPPSATAKRQELAGKSFIATGLSLVIHPRNPFVPTSHANFRIFIAGADTDNPIWWFGGGFDLTPYYPFEEDAIHWHQTAKIFVTSMIKPIIQNSKNGVMSIFISNIVMSIVGLVVYFLMI